MPMWQYGQLTVRSRARGKERTILWRGPGERAAENYSANNQPVAVLLNQFGADGWELVGIQNYREVASGFGPGEPDRVISEYLFKRPYVPTLVSLTVYCLPPGDAGIETTVGHTSERLYGRLLIERKVGRPHNQADIDRIDSLRTEREEPGTSERRREQIDEAVAGYAASFLVGQVGDAWWATPGDFPLANAADLLNESAEWLRGLIEHPLEEIASAAGADGLFPSVGAGIAANFVTVRLTAPLEGAARLCEVAGIIVGLAAGAHPLVMACAKRLLHDELGQAVTREFTNILGSTGQDRETPDSREAAESRDARDTAEHRNGRDTAEPGSSQGRAPGSDLHGTNLADAGQGWDGSSFTGGPDHPPPGGRALGRPGADDPPDTERRRDYLPGQDLDRPGRSDGPPGRGDGPDIDDGLDYGGRGGQR
jgi:hypothetical protein